jgi:hypothetical protein
VLEELMPRAGETQPPHDLLHPALDARNFGQSQVVQLARSHPCRGVLGDQLLVVGGTAGQAR